MGITIRSSKKKILDYDGEISKSAFTKLVTIAGNPNVGKSSIFNELTGMKQHTGNWPGKTVCSAYGMCEYNGKNYIFADIPGTYSLIARSKEEEVARDFICFSESDVIVIVCDATCFERNMNLVLQCMEITDNVVICLNLIDEAKKKKIEIDTDEISRRLGVKIIKTCALEKKGFKDLLEEIQNVSINNKTSDKVIVNYPEYIEKAVSCILPFTDKIKEKSKINSRWIALKFIEGDSTLKENLIKRKLITKSEKEEIEEEIEKFKIDRFKFQDDVAVGLVTKCEQVCKGCIKTHKAVLNRADKILTGKISGRMIMIALLMLVFYITVSGANAISELLSGIMFFLEEKLMSFFIRLNISETLRDILVCGVFRVTGWVISVMFPPMAIFFPMFAFLEDVGYLPRVAFNLDKSFKKCGACGKQALTMCMGFGCNAAGITGCRIIDSPRERMIASLTNSLVPCNGKFPTLIAVITIFFVFSFAEPMRSLIGAMVLTAFVLLSIVVTFCVSKILSKTLLKGENSSVVMEMPPYRRPKIRNIVVRSVFDRIVFVLLRAISVAAPAGAIIWIVSNVSINNISVMNILAGFLEPFAKLMGLDGFILLAFILALPANELVIPLIIMAYTSSGSITSCNNYMYLKEIFIENGWNLLTAFNVMIFSLMHWPCSTSIITLKKETGSFKWAFIGFLIPTIIGIILCMITTFLFGKLI